MIDADRKLICKTDDDDVVPPQQRPRHRDQLPLSRREIETARRDLAVEGDDDPLLLDDGHAGID